MTTEHKHAAVLRAIADGKVVQWQSIDDGSWNNQRGFMNPLSENYLNWRVKPEPKPDAVRFAPVYKETGWPLLDSAKAFHPDASGFVRVTIDGETGKPKSVEIVG